jgi:hypothetical protein
MLTEDSPTHEAVSFNAHITDGTSNTLFGNSLTVQLPILQLAGFCDGSVRPVEDHNRSPFNIHFRQAAFFSNLNAVDPNNPNNKPIRHLTLPIRWEFTDRHFELATAACCSSGGPRFEGAASRPARHPFCRARGRGRRPSTGVMASAARSMRASGSCHLRKEDEELLLSSSRLLKNDHDRRNDTKQHEPTRKRLRLIGDIVFLSCGFVDLIAS